MPKSKLPNYVPAPVSLFTPEEHAILSDWLGLDPPADTPPAGLDESLKVLGFAEKAETIHWGGLRLYSNTDAAVAHVLLHTVAEWLPTWAAVNPDSSGAQGVIKAPRSKSPWRPARRVISLMPRRLFGINWASTAPGYDWPEEYWLCWVPHYGRYVVTMSGDTSDTLGYSDFAIGAFSSRQRIHSCVGKIVEGHWAAEVGEWDQARWNSFRGGGLIDEKSAQRWADRVWGNPARAVPFSVVGGQASTGQHPGEACSEPLPYEHDDREDEAIEAHEDECENHNSYDQGNKRYW